MDFFKISLKRIFSKIPIKLLIIILITLLLLFVCITPSFCAGVKTLNYEINNTSYKVECYDEDKGFFYVIDGNTYLPKYFCFVASGTQSNIIFNTTNKQIRCLNNNNFIKCDFTFNDTTSTYNFNVVGGVGNLYTLASDDILFYSNRNIYNTDNTVYLSSNTYNYSVLVNPPKITNDTNSIQNWSLNSLQISSGDVTLSQNLILSYYYCSSDNIQVINGQTYYSWVQGKIILNSSSPYISDFDAYGHYLASIPKTELFKTVTLRTNDVIYFNLYNSENKFDINTQIYTLTISENSVIDNENNKTSQQLDNISNSINNVTSTINSLGDSISSHFWDAPLKPITDGWLSEFNDNVEDFTGVDGLFTKLYNAFCTDTIQEIDINLPFVNVPFHIGPDNLSSKVPLPIKNLVGIFSWGFVLLFIVKDLREIFDKIFEGNPEQVSSDVKKEVL